MSRDLLFLQDPGEVLGGGVKFQSSIQSAKFAL